VKVTKVFARKYKIHSILAAKKNTDSNTSGWSVAKCLTLGISVGLKTM